MLLKNMDSTLVNGSLGIVVGFTGEAPYNTTYALLKCLAPNRTMNDDFSADTLLSMECPVVEFADNRQIIIEEDSWNFETQSKFCVRMFC
ncbi:hypothetical protein BDF14DRAFT_1867416 [Spinellus fusiger]|nr:hypothetical protein BDF14DRAFT_1867416 [Spinellus fusiger]